MRWPAGSNAWRNAVAGFLGGYGVVAFFLSLWLMLRWEHLAPSHANPAYGQVFPHSDHGWITYFTAFQATSCAVLFPTSIPLAFVAELIVPKRNVEIRRRFLGLSWRWDPDDPGKWSKVGTIWGLVGAPLIIFGLGPYVISGLNRLGVFLNF